MLRNHDEKGEKQKNKNSEDDRHLIKQMKIQHINDDDWEKMSDSLKALEEDIQEDVSPRQLRWDSWGIGDEESQENCSDDEDEMDDD